jgi:hypothetical protein
MLPALPEEPWKEVGIPGQCSVDRLLYNRPSDALIVIASQRHEDGPPFQRLYYRRLPEKTYRPVPIRHPLESQTEALSCSDVPFVVFNELVFRKPEPVPEYLKAVTKGKLPPQGHGADWRGIRRFNLISAEDKLLLDEENLAPFPPYTSGWVSGLISVSADGTGGICTVGLTAGGMMRYFVCELSFTEGIKKAIAELPHIFL